MSRSTKGDTDQQNFVGRLVVRYLDLTSEPHYPHKTWSEEAILRWLVTSGIDQSKPYVAMKSPDAMRIKFSQRQASPAARIYVAQSELP